MTDAVWKNVVTSVEKRLQEVPSFMIGYEVFASRLNLSPDDWLDILKRLEEKPAPTWDLKVEKRGEQRIIIVQKK